MKKRSILALIALFLLCTLLASPYLLERRPLQDRLLEYVKQSLGVTATVGGIEWRWFPVPAILVNQLRAEAATFTLVLPQAHLILNPISLISSKMKLAHAKLLEPELTIKAYQPATAFEDILPTDHLSLVNGTLNLPERVLGQQLMLQSVRLSEITGTVSSRAANTIKVDLRANSDFASNLEFKGSLDLRQGTYQLDVKGSALDSRRLLCSVPPRGVLCSVPAPQADDPPTVSEEDSPLPSVTGLTLAAHLEGQGRDRYQLQIGSGKEPFWFRWRDQTLRIAKVGAITVSRKANDLSFDIDGLSLASPRLLLSGRVARELPNHSATATPIWSIDLNGSDIDLAAVRTSVLTFFGENQIAQKVCAIVGGGSANTARFAFTGVAADLQHLANMKIWADAKDVPITVPDINLAIDKASGPIAIIDDQLTGKDLTATIDKSQGVNGELLLNLKKDEHDFRLDLDLDADLQNLQDVLAQIIPSHKFKEELSRFQKIKGRAQGHLRLGDDLHQLKTEVKVEKVEASGTYDRLPWPFTISEGVVEVSHHPRRKGALQGVQQVAWENIRGSIGRQRVSRSTGSVAWQEEIQAAINVLDADLDLKSLFEEGTLRTNTATIALRDLARGRFAEVSGQARLSKSSFSGPLRSPEQWQFHSALLCRDFTVTPAEIPELKAQTLEAEIDQQKIDFAGIFALLDQEIFLAGHYDHKFFEQWQGDLEINGEIGEQLGALIRKRNRFPAIAYLKHPFRVENFIVSTPKGDLDSFLATGTILPVSPATAIKMQVTKTRQSNQQIDTLTFQNGNQQGILTYQVWPDQEKRSLLTWQGELENETVLALFQRQFLQSGQIQGAFSRLTELDRTTYSGSIEAKAIRFLPDSLTPELTIDTLHLQGNDNSIAIEGADFTLSGQPATISGRIAEAQGARTLDLEVTAPQFSWASVQKLFDVYHRKKTEGAQEKSALDSIRGTISFDIGSFDYIRQTKNSGQSPPEGEAVQSPPGESDVSTAAEANSHTFTSAPFTGRMEFKPTGIALQIDKSTVCGISGHGTWHFGTATEENSIAFASSQEPLVFEEALPCLGIKQSLIQGPFSLQGHISGRPKDWQQGEITLLSTEGLIKRMSLLSMIFTAVNFADYLTTWHNLPDMQDEGLLYNDLTLKAHVDSNNLILDRTVIRGKGVNLSGRGSINLTTLDSDLTFFIAPFKGLDWAVTNLPLIGKALAGPKESILTFPVAVTGNLKSPEVTALAPSAIGSAVFELFRDTMTLPFRIFQPEQDSP